MVVAHAAIDLDTINFLAILSTKFGPLRTSMANACCRKTTAHDFLLLTDDLVQIERFLRWRSNGAFLRQRYAGRNQTNG